MPSTSPRVGTAAPSTSSGQAPGCPTGRSPAARQLPVRFDLLGALPLVFFLGSLLFFPVVLSSAVPQKRLSIYSTVANYSLPIVQRPGRDYVGLLEVLEPLGTVSAKADGLHWRLHYNNILGEFTVDKNHARIQGHDADLSAKFLMENGRGLVPLASLNSLLPRFLGGPATLHEDSNRLFIGNIATHFTASVSPNDPSHLVFHFTAPVNPSIASEPGYLRLTFRREPLTAPASPMLTFNSKTIPSADYSENNGAAEINVTTNIPLLATFSADNRTITLAPPKPQAAVDLPAAPAATASSATPAQGKPLVAQPAPAVAASSVPRRYFAI